MALQNLLKLVTIGLNMLALKVDKEIYAEVRIGLVNEADDVLDDVFARLLISRDPEHKFCHMLWNATRLFLNQLRVLSWFSTS